MVSIPDRYAKNRIAVAAPRYDCQVSIPDRYAKNSKRDLDALEA